MSDKGKTYLDLFVSTLEMAVMFIPVLFLSNFILSENTKGALILALTSAVLTGFAAISSNFCPLYRRIKHPAHPLLIIKNWVCPIFCFAIYCAIYYLDIVFPSLYEIKMSYI